MIDIMMGIIYIVMPIYLAIHLYSKIKDLGNPPKDNEQI